MRTHEWLKEISGGASVNAIATKSDVRQSTIATQLASASGLKPETAVKIARAYGADPVVALVEVGLLRAEEVSIDAGELRKQIAADLAQARLDGMSDAELTAEVRRLISEIDRRFADRERQP